MAWDVAYLAMQKDGEIPGNYHGLGADIMKALPDAIKDPLYIVKQKTAELPLLQKSLLRVKKQCSLL